MKRGRGKMKKKKNIYYRGEARLGRKRKKNSVWATKDASPLVVNRGVSTKRVNIVGGIVSIRMKEKMSAILIKAVSRYN